MKASEKKITKLFAETNTQFIIPVYQRSYNWEEKHCQILFKDIKKISEDKEIVSHFMGSIVYIHNGIYETGEITQLDIIDGQQRITTLTLLFLAIYYKLKELQNERKANKIYNQYIINQFVDEDNNLKLILPEENLNILEKISLSNNIQEFLDYKHNNLVKNFLYFQDTIKDYTEEDIQKIIVGIDKLIYINISLEKGKDDPQKIFESLNSTGLDLSQGDLIRNYILMGLSREEQNKIYKKFWIPIENNCKVVEKNTIINYVSDFIRDYLTLKSNKIVAKTQVFETFKNFYKKLEELEELVEYSQAYAILRKPDLEKDPILRKNYKYLKALDQTVINPFLIGIIKDYNNGVIIKEELIEILEILQSYLWRRYITGEPSNSLNKIFQNLYSKIIREDKYLENLKKILIAQDFPTDDELKTNLKVKAVYKDKEKLRYVFERIENFCHNELIDFSNDKITIEHILPQKPNKNWKENYSEEELNEMFKYKDTISNLTLTGSNSNLSNKSFIEKRDDLQHGYKNSKLFLNKYLGNLDEWNTLKMEERFEILFSYIIKIWKRPEIIEEDSLEKIIFILNGKNGSGKAKLLRNEKLRLLEGTKIPIILVDSIKEKFKKIIIELLEKNIIEEYEEYYLFKKETDMSPSTAASLVLGRSANGWKEWKTYDGVYLNNFRRNNSN